MNKYLLLGILFFVILLAGVGLIISSQHIGFDEFLRSFSDLNARVLGLVVLPFIALAFALGVYLRKKNEERKWKQALMRTRAEKAKKLRDQELRGQGQVPEPEADRRSLDQSQVPE